MMRFYRCATAIALLLVGSLQAFAQDPAAAAPARNAGGYLPPLEIKADMKLREKRREIENSVSRLYRGTASFDAQAQNDAREWFEGFFFPAMTTPELYAEVGGMRRKFTRDLQAVKQPQVYDFLANLMITNAKRLVEANYPPQTRINAMVLLAELNEGDKGTGPAPTPTPHAPVLPYLREKLVDANTIDGVRLVALAGIHRHVESHWWAGSQPPNLEEMQRDMLTIVTAVDPPAGRSKEAHAWFRARAADVLGSLNGWSPNNAAFVALSDILADSQAPISLRCRAAYAIGRFDYTKLPNVDPVDLATLTGNIGGLLADACEVEVTWLDKQQEELAEGGLMMAGGMQGGGMMGGGMMGGGAMGGGAMGGGAMGGGAMGGAMGRGGMGRGAGGGGARGSRGGAKDEDEDAGAGGGGFPFNSGSGGAGGAGGAITEEAGPDTGGLPVYMVDAARRRLLYEVACVRMSVIGPGDTFKGIEGLAATNPQATANVESIKNAVTELAAAIEVKDYKLTEMLSEIRTNMQTLEGLRAQAATEEAEEAESEITIPGAEEAEEAVPMETTPMQTAPATTDNEVPAGESADVTP